MAHLSLAGVSEDGRKLLLVNDENTLFTVDITPALRAAIGGKNSRIGQLETKMNSSLRPRDIQTRIRCGESPEAVAEAAGTTVEAIMPYVAPVVAEREHVAERAQRSSLRRGAGEGGASSSGRVLGETVAAHLRGLEADPSSVTWDAYRRETGRWVLTATYATASRSGTARFTFDPPGNYALTDNDDARWLVGDLVGSAPAPRDDLLQARQRRMAAISDELPLGDDALDLATSEPTSATAPGAPAEPTEPRQPAAQAQPEVEPAPLEPTADGEPDVRPRRTPPKKRGRASVPSWDEIMFGGGDQ
ncbi:septation protein SepH [Nocardioides sp. YIM 152588]|uniref:septation protein SepH n=1 Tax=Nocardioides sp. YIM 152588 TaxID=3158259 RepID=UPI0032E4AD53